MFTNTGCLGHEWDRDLCGDCCRCRRVVIGLQMGVADEAACPGWSFQELKLLQKGDEIALVAVCPADGCGR